MRERPILFSGSMVRAVLTGQKTQTRRIMKQQPSAGVRRSPFCASGLEDGHGREIHSRYGRPGDRLWVREAWGVVTHDWNADGDAIDWIPDRPATVVHEMPFGQVYYSGHVIYAADGPFDWAGDDDGDGEPRSAWKPSIHMPRVASRITLEITDLRVQRLQDISEADAQAEGADALSFDNCGVVDRALFGMPLMENGTPYRNGFALLWEIINGDGSWAANPFVWVVEFRRLDHD